VFIVVCAVYVIAGKMVDELVMLAFDEKGQFNALESPLATCSNTSESVFLWQLAVGLPVEPAAAVVTAMHRAAVCAGNSGLISGLFLAYFSVFTCSLLAGIYLGYGCFNIHVSVTS